MFIELLMFELPAAPVETLLLLLLVIGWLTLVETLESAPPAASEMLGLPPVALPPVTLKPWLTDWVEPALELLVFEPAPTVGLPPVEVAEFTFDTLLPAWLLLTLPSVELLDEFSTSRPTPT
jgi:hypothetical protein